MPITINGSGTVTGISAGGLPDGVIKAPDLDGAQTGTAPIYGCRAWVNFDGTRNETDTGASTNGANVKIRASGNVSSVLKNGVGDYTITFTTAMPDAYFSAVFSSAKGSASYAGNEFQLGNIAIEDKATGFVRVQATNDAINVDDCFDINAAIFR